MLVSESAVIELIGGFLLNPSNESHCLQSCTVCFQCLSLNLICASKFNIFPGYQPKTVCKHGGNTLLVCFYEMWALESKFYWHLCMFSTCSRKCLLPGYIHPNMCLSCWWVFRPPYWANHEDSVDTWYCLAAKKKDNIDDLHNILNAWLCYIWSVFQHPYKKWFLGKSPTPAW